MSDTEQCAHLRARGRACMTLFSVVDDRDITVVDDRDITAVATFDHFLQFCQKSPLKPGGSRRISTMLKGGLRSTTAFRGGKRGLEELNRLRKRTVIDGIL